MGAFLELRLEPAVRLIYQFTILIPSYNVQNRVPFFDGYQGKKMCISSILADQTDLSKEDMPALSSSSLLSSTYCEK